MTLEQSAAILTELSNFLGISMPENEREQRFFAVQIIETVKHDHKKAALYDELAKVLHKVVQGR